MAEYIERGALLEEVRKRAKAFSSVLIYEAIKEAPTADVVEVVRCRDCKHFTKGMAIGMCKRIEDKPIIPCHCEHYCSYGKNE